MALAMGALFAAGAVIGAISLVLPHPDEFNTTALWSNVALAAVGSIIALLVADRAPVGAMKAAILIGALVCTRAVFYSGEATGFYTFFYIWVGLYAFYFFGRAWGALAIAWVGINYAWVLTQIPNTSPVGRWLMCVGTIAVGGAFVDALAGRVRRSGESAGRQARALEAVDEVAHELGRATTPKDAAAGICTAVAKASESSGAILWQMTSDGTGLEATAATVRGLEGARLMFIGPPSGAVTSFTSRKQLFVPEVESHPDVDQNLVAKLDVVSALFQPILREGVAVGVIAVHWSHRVTELDDIVSRTVTLLAAESSLAIERAELMDRLERAARTDDLTGLPNRGAWNEEITREMARARRAGTALCLALIDLDRFKQFNDTHGHQAGDRLLKESASRWADELRETDLLARYGGDEFALALPDCEIAEARELLERIRAATPEGEIASAGVVRWDGRETEADLFARADKALYAAKDGGRDRIAGG